MTTELEMCPFCGSKEIKSMENSDYNGVYAVECFECGANGPSDSTLDAAIEAWNQRACIFCGGKTPCHCQNDE